MLANPYIYGRPVQSAKFVNRSWELKTLQSRVASGQSTAIGGGPQVGKTSLLLKLRDWLLDSACSESPGAPCIPRFIDLHRVDEGFTPAMFWAEALEGPSVLNGFQARLVPRALLERAREAGFKGSALMKRFQSLGETGHRLVLLLDEFERLLLLPGFQSPSFFVQLRSAATTTGGLAVVIASRWSVSQLNLWCRGLLPAGSPVFNFMIEATLRPFEDAFVDQMLDWASERFDAADRCFIQRIAGGQPFLVQAASGVMFDTEGTGLARLVLAGARLYNQISSHFDDWWAYLGNEDRTPAVVLGLTELAGQQEWIGPEAKTSYWLSRVDRELARLERLGIAKRVVSPDWPFDREHLPENGGERWTICSQALTWWLYDVFVLQQRSVDSCTQWLGAREYERLISTEDWEDLLNAVRTRFQGPRGVEAVITALAQELMEGLGRA